jgi:hypothetical protein
MIELSHLVFGLSFTRRIGREGPRRRIALVTEEDVFTKRHLHLIVAENRLQLLRRDRLVWPLAHPRIGHVPKPRTSELLDQSGNSATLVLAGLATQQLRHTFPMPDGDVPALGCCCPKTRLRI